MYVHNFIYLGVGVVTGVFLGWMVKVESQTKYVEIQPKCVHKFKSLSCIITGETLTKTANVIQECEHCGKLEKTRMYL